MNSQLTSLPMCGFIAQLVEHHTGIAEVTGAEVTGSNPVEALIFFRLLYSDCLNWKFTAKITYHLHIYPQFIYESFHIHYIKVIFVAPSNATFVVLKLYCNENCTKITSVNKIAD